MIPLLAHSHLKWVSQVSYLVLIPCLRSRSDPSASATMSLELYIEESSQMPMHHGVAVCKNIAMNQAYYFFSEDCCSIQFAAAHTSLRDVGYDDIHIPPFSWRENWHRYHPTAPLVDREVAV